MYVRFCFNFKYFHSFVRGLKNIMHFIMHSCRALCANKVSSLLRYSPIFIRIKGHFHSNPEQLEIFTEWGSITYASFDIFFPMNGNMRWCNLVKQNQYSTCDGAHPGRWVRYPSWVLGVGSQGSPLNVGIMMISADTLHFWLLLAPRAHGQPPNSSIGSKPSSRTKADNFLSFLENNLLL